VVVSGRRKGKRKGGCAHVARGRPGQQPGRRFSPELNETRTHGAATRDVPVARRAIALRPEHPEWPTSWMAVAVVRAEHPQASWTRIGEILGTSKDSAVAKFRRLRERVTA